MEGKQQQIEELEGLESQGAAADSEGEYIPGKDGPGPEQQQQKEQHSTADVLAPILQISFGLVAARRGKHWALSDGEAKEAAEAYSAVLDKYYPDAAMGPEVTAVIVTLAVVGPRLGQDRVYAEQKAAAEREANAGKSETDQDNVDGNLSE